MAANGISQAVLSLQNLPSVKSGEFATLPSVLNQPINYYLELDRTHQIAMAAVMCLLALLHIGSYTKTRAGYHIYLSIGALLLAASDIVSVTVYHRAGFIITLATHWVGVSFLLSTTADLLAIWGKVARVTLSGAAGGITRFVSYLVMVLLILGSVACTVGSNLELNWLQNGLSASKDVYEASQRLMDAGFYTLLAGTTFMFLLSSGMVLLALLRGGEYATRRNQAAAIALAFLVFAAGFVCIYYRVTPLAPAICTAIGLVFLLYPSDACYDSMRQLKFNGAHVV